MFIYSTWPHIRPDIWLFSVSGIRPVIRQVKSRIRPDTEYQKGRIIWPDIRCNHCNADDYHDDHNDHDNHVGHDHHNDHNVLNGNVGHNNQDD
jgi:hypothetical protein